MKAGQSRPFLFPASYLSCYRLAEQSAWLETACRPRLSIGRKPQRCYINVVDESFSHFSDNQKPKCVLRSEPSVSTYPSSARFFPLSPPLSFLITMTSVEVTAVVDSIVSAFARGMEIFRRIKLKQISKKRRRKPDKLTKEEWQLQNSLLYRPKEIRAEYDRSLARLGGLFAVGDSTAQTSLNHTLLVLNTGLIKIISHALSDDTKAQALSRRSLLNLSETAAADAVRALEQLHTRLSSTLRPAATAPPSSTNRAHRKGEDILKAVVGSGRTRPAFKPRSKSFSTIERKRPGPDPLVRGAWVRSKSGASVINASSSSSGTSTPKPSHHKTALTSFTPVQGITIPRPSHHRTSSSPAYSKWLEHRKPTRPPFEPASSCFDLSPPFHVACPKQQHHRYLNRQPSLLPVSPEVFTDTQTSFFQSPPPLPPKIPLDTSDPSPDHPRPRSAAPRTLRTRATSVATFLTASTKIGEIPEHRWLTINHNNDPNPARPTPPWEQRQPPPKPLPCVIPPRLEDEQQPPTRKKGRGFRFWKRHDSNNEHPAVF